MDVPEANKKGLFTSLFVLLCILCAYFAIKALSEIKQYTLLGASGIPATISFTGHGEVKAIPDIATVNFSVESSKSTQATASAEVNVKTKKILDLLKSSGVLEKDIKTENYSSYPKYSNPSPCYYDYERVGGILPPCPATESKIIGYTVSQSVSVKIRKVDDASKIVDGINTIGVSNMYGPNFTIDNEDSLKAEARKKAIDDAQMKAKLLAKDLGVRLEKISGFNEDGSYPIYYAKDSLMGRGGGEEPAPTQLPKGENTITSDVTITYEIR